MLNRKYFPFERNSYYHGKLLTAKDFENEQRYLNDKRRFVNRLSGGSGIVSGLGVVMADDTSIVLQAGCAYDASGREIVVPETRVVKLSTIEGLDTITTACAYLEIAYAEQPADEVYAAMGDPNGANTFNKVRESYKLALMDENLVNRVQNPMDEFVAELPVYSDDDIQVIQYAPRFVPAHSDVVVKAVIHKKSQGAEEYAFEYTLDAPGFTGPNGENSFNVSLSGLILKHEESAEVSHVLSPKPHIWGGGDVELTITGFVIKKGSESFHVNEKLRCAIKPVERDMLRYYLDVYYQKPMDKQLTESYDEKLWIAKLLLFRQKNSVIIDRVLPAPFGQYAYNARQLMELKRLEEFLPSVDGFAREVAAAGSIVGSAQVGRPDALRQTACGVIDIGVGLSYSTREPAFSEEIMHGLGKGPVYVDVGVEYVDAAADGGAGNSEIVLGDARLFAGRGSRSENERVYNVSMAVKVLPERGTFIVAVQPKTPSDDIIGLHIRWFAVRMSEISKQITGQRDGERYILVNPDTIVVPPKGTAHISPVFINMQAEACRFQLVNVEGGSIDKNGLYTAPAKEGVYEIRVEVLSDPTIFTHAFAIVTQKKKENGENGKGK